MSSTRYMVRGVKDGGVVLSTQSAVMAMHCTGTGTESNINGIKYVMSKEGERRK